jgi:hypothetical protein
LAAICDGRVGAVLAIEASRLARNGRDWHTLIEWEARKTGVGSFNRRFIVAFGEHQLLRLKLALGTYDEKDRPANVKGGRFRLGCRAIIYNIGPL